MTRENVRRLADKWADDWGFGSKVGNRDRAAMVADLGDLLEAVRDAAFEQAIVPARQIERIRSVLTNYEMNDGRNDLSAEDVVRAIDEVIRG